MDYAAWKLFVDAAELGSLSKVAVAYGTSQPHISRQIGELEQECGGRLFQRTGRGVVLTEFGQRIEGDDQQGVAQPLGGGAVLDALEREHGDRPTAPDAGHPSLAAGAAA